MNNNTKPHTVGGYNHRVDTIVSADWCKGGLEQK